MSTSLDEIERVFLALGDKTRIRLVDLMRNGEVSVNYLCESLSESQPKVSRHLAYLRSMGLVCARRDGKWIYYRLSLPENRFGSRLLQATLDWVESTSGGPPRSVTTNVHKVEPIAKVINSRNDFDTYGYPDMKSDRDELEIYLL